MQLNVKNAKGLVFVLTAAAVVIAIAFAVGQDALALAVLAVSVVGYLIYSIGKSGLPGAEPEAEQEQQEAQKNSEKEWEKGRVPPPARDHVTSRH
jgi:type III secretory pathway component EscV